MIVKNFKDNLDDDMEIVVEESTDPYDPMPTILYSGSIGKCPAELDSLTIDKVGRSLVAEQEGRTLYYLFHLMITQ